MIRVNLSCSSRPPVSDWAALSPACPRCAALFSTEGSSLLRLAGSKEHLQCRISRPAASPRLGPDDSSPSGPSFLRILPGRRRDSSTHLMRHSECRRRDGPAAPG